MAEGGAEPRRDIIVLAIDGVPASLARRCWPAARIETLRSVFPTTSSSAWLTAMSGESVDDHGIPGVVFALDNGTIVNLYHHQEPWAGASTRNVFDDAAEQGYTPIAITADLEVADCSWSRLLVRGARRRKGMRFFAGLAGRVVPAVLGDRLRLAVADALSDEAAAGPRLVWCFMELDRHVHEHGYDSTAIECLEIFGRLAASWATEGHIVVAHSDHGLVRTMHDPAVDSVLAEACRRYRSRMGGAGRTRWFHGIADQEVPEAIRWMTSELGDLARACPADDVFLPGRLARRRVGSVVLTALGERFATFDGHTHDHGSQLADEVETPYGCWCA